MKLKLPDTGSSHLRCSVKKVSKKFRNFDKKIPESLFKIVFLKRQGLFKKELQHRYFLVKFAKFLRTPILKKICERLLLDI